ncbi:Transposon Tf2-6 poly, partial [Paramuricea clavata]
MSKVDHFIGFVNRPYFHQDVAFGIRKLKLESGETIEMPNVIRTVTRSTMVAQYQHFCAEQSFDPLSRSTLFRILEVREASQRKSLSGLDNTAVDGSKAFQTMIFIAEQLVNVGVDKSWSTDIENRLNAGKQYLKTDYKVHCQESSSPCADHCRSFSLSDPCDKDFQEKCKHSHVMTCSFCDNIKSVVGDIEEKIKQHSHPLFTKEHQEDLLDDFYEANDHIKAWKAQIMRSANQELAKQNVLRDLDESSVLAVMDWAMKFPQIKYREKQSEWFGKRGMSWHVSSVVSKTDDTEELSVTSYVHLFDQTTQDWFAVASILENLIDHIKSSKPLVRKIFLRSDEAGCYHNNLLITAIQDIAHRTGVAACLQYCNEGHDVCDAQQMHVASKKHLVRGTSISVAKISKSATHLNVIKIKNVSSYHNFEYVENGIKVWKAYGIGKGKKLSNKEIYVTHQEPTAIEVIEPFMESTDGRKLKINTNDSMTEEVQGLFECNEPGCNYVFNSFDQLELHREIGTHSRFIKNESVFDTLRREWAKKFTTIEDNSSTQSVQPSSKSLKNGKTDLQMGWALSKPKTGSIRFSDKIRQYLTFQFDC